MAAYSRKWIILIILLQVLLSTAGGVGAAYYHHNKTICRGIEASGILLEGLDPSAAKEKLQKELISPSMLTLCWDEKCFPIPLYSGVYDYLVDDTIEEAISLSSPNSGTWLGAVNGFTGTGAFLNIIRWRPYRHLLEVPLVISPSYLNSRLDGLRKYIDREPQNATFIVENGIPFYLEESPGARLDTARSKAVVEEFLERGEYEQIPLQVDVVPPGITGEHLPDFRQCLASFETFLENDNNRSHNIKLASETLNGLVLEPGQIFSFNETIGHASKEKGFLEAPVLQNRKLVPGIGGGICQVATTLYQAALRAELEIVQRASHSRPVAYVSLGQDATVAYNLLDLKIKNNKDFPIIFTSRAESSLLFSIYGAEKDNAREIEILTGDVEIIPPRLLEHHDPNLAKGTRHQFQKGEEGYQVEVYRLVYVDGVEESRELISTDRYSPVNEIVYIGTKEILQLEK